MHSHAGALVTFERKPYILVSKADKACALFGPYMKLPPGDYFVQFEIRLESDWRLAPEDVVCQLDIAVGIGSGVVAAMDVEAKRLRPRAPTKIRLPFSLDRTAEQLEFRVWPSGTAAFAVALERPVEGAVATREPAEAHLSASP